MSRIITLHDHPPETAVLYAADSDIIAAARETAWLLDQFSSVVVLRPKDTLEESWRKACGDPNIHGDMYSEFYISPHRFHKKLETHGNVEYGIVEESSLSQAYGNDFLIFGKFCQTLGPCYTAVMSKSLQKPHIETGYDIKETLQLSGCRLRYEETNSWPLLPGGVAATMALHMAGTQIIEIVPGELIRTQEGTREVWEWNKPLNIASERIWDTPAGAIIVLRSKRWDKDHLPSPHRAPPREREGDPTERVICTGAIAGL